MPAAPAGLLRQRPDLAVLHVAAHPTVLPSDTGLVASVLESAGLAEH
jgi:hypothetical protein